MELNGLNDEEVIKSRKKYGTNNVESTKHNTFISLLVESLGDPIIKILLIALAVKVIFLFKNDSTFNSEITSKLLPLNFQIFLATVSTPYILLGVTITLSAYILPYWLDIITGFSGNILVVFKYSY